MGGQIHSESPPGSAEELQALVDKLRPEITGIANPAGCNMLRNFGHLMNQYSAAYYGYMWCVHRLAPSHAPPQASSAAEICRVE